MPGKHEIHPQATAKPVLKPVTKAELERRGRVSSADPEHRDRVPSAAPAKRKRSVVWTIVFWVALAVFLVAAFFAGRILLSYHEGTAEYEDLARDVLELPSDEQILTLSDLKVDWETLQKTNGDTVGWMYVPGTVINYPVVWCGNDYTYLTRSFSRTGEHAVDFGAIFMEGENHSDLSDPHTILFGHAMKNGTMFAPFYRMSWNDTFNTYRDIYYLTPSGNLHLKTFAYVWVPATEMSALTTTFKTDAERIAFVQDKINRSKFETDDAIPDAKDITTFFSFITCDSAAGTGRYIVYAYVLESTYPGIEGFGGIDPNAPGGITADLVEGLGW